MSLPTNTSFEEDDNNFEHQIPKAKLIFCIVLGFFALIVNIVLLIFSRKKYPNTSDPFDGPIHHMLYSNSGQYLVLSVVQILAHTEAIRSNWACQITTWIMIGGGIFGK